MGGGGSKKKKQVNANQPPNQRSPTPKVEVNRPATQLSSAHSRTGSMDSQESSTNNKGPPKAGMGDNNSRMYNCLT
jgi:hypothetical protein